jgi:hypothetical protein
MLLYSSCIIFTTYQQLCDCSRFSLHISIPSTTFGTVASSSAALGISIPNSWLYRSARTFRRHPPRIRATHSPSTPSCDRWNLKTKRLVNYIYPYQRRTLARRSHSASHRRKSELPSLSPRPSNRAIMSSRRRTTSTTHEWTNFEVCLS